MNNFTTHHLSTNEHVSYECTRSQRFYQKLPCLEHSSFKYSSVDCPVIMSQKELYFIHFLNNNTVNVLFKVT